MKNFALMVGPPGSGKTTYSNESLKGYVRCSQDEQGKAGYMRKLRESLEAGVDVVVDRTNPTRAQRAELIDLAKKAGYGTAIYWLNEQQADCLKRIRKRKDHPTLRADNAIGIAAAMKNYFYGFQVPSAREVDKLVVIGDKPKFTPVRDIREEIGDRRHIIVGDVHGCLYELQEMLEELKFDMKEDVLILAGDLVDRGPMSKEVIEFCMSVPRFHSVIGNHDDRCLRYFEALNGPEGNRVEVKWGLSKTISSLGGKLDEDKRKFIEAFPSILRIPAGYVVHGGFDPLMTPEEQQRNDCMFMRFYGGNGYFDDELGVDWWKLWPSDAPRVFFGHVVHESFPDLPNVTPLDGGCVFGGYLKAWDSRDGIVHFVSAWETHCADHGAD